MHEDQVCQGLQAGLHHAEPGRHWHGDAHQDCPRAGGHADARPVAHVQGTLHGGQAASEEEQVPVQDVKKCQVGVTSFTTEVEQVRLDSFSC